VIGNNPQTVAVDRFYRLLVALEIADPAELTAALIDWLDSGDDPFTLIQTDDLELPVIGAEDLYYQSLAMPYACKNGPLESLEELLIVKGFTKEIFQMISPYLSATDSKQININTAEGEVLRSLSSKVGEQTVELILASRQEAPIRNISSLKDLLADDQFSLLKTLANQRLLGTTSDYYKITSEAIINDGRCSLETLFDKKTNNLSYIRKI
jgi:general secretion pathway protein K